MASTFLSLMGMFPSELHQLITQRLSLIAETSQEYSTTETIFHRGPETPVDDSNILRLRCTRLASTPKEPIWSLLVFQKPDPVSQSPDILSRMCIEAPLAEGDPFALASVLGYTKKATTNQKGLRFQRGAVAIEVYQLYESTTSSSPISSHQYIITLSTRCANPRPPPTNPNPNSNTNVNTNPGTPGQAGAGPQPPQYAGPTAQELKIEATERIKEVQSVLKGLVDLRRVEV